MVLSCADHCADVGRNVKIAHRLHPLLATTTRRRRQRKRNVANKRARIVIELY